MASKNSHRSILNFFVILASSISLVPGATAVRAEDFNTQTLLREADKAVGKRTIRSKRPNSWGALGGPNFSGRWWGTYSLASANCPVGIQRFNFRHVLYQSGGAVSLNTNHDGGFYGSSRDRGRRLEFTKTITLRNGTMCALAVVYKDLAKHKRSTNTGYAVACGSCLWTYGAIARR
jgi:hypothetical protein